METVWETDDGAEQEGGKPGCASSFNGSFSSHSSTKCWWGQLHCISSRQFAPLENQAEMQRRPAILGWKWGYRLPCMVICQWLERLKCSRGCWCPDPYTHGHHVRAHQLVFWLPHTAFLCLEACSQLPKWQSWNTRESIASGGSPQLMSDRFWWINKLSLASWVG